MIRTTSQNICLIATLTFPAMLASCGNSTSLPDPQAAFHEVTRTANGMRTGYRIDQEGERWRFFTHDDQLEENWCGDLALSADGRMRYLAFMHRTPAGPWMLSVRTGLGPSTWSTEFSGVEVSAGDGQCHGVRIQRVGDEKYVVVWRDEGTLHHALFDPAQSPPGDLTVGEPWTIPDPGPGQHTMVWWNNRVKYIWSAHDGNRIQTLTGDLEPTGVDFEQASTFTTLETDEISDAITHDGALYLAAREGDNIILLRTTTGGTGWEQLHSCESPTAHITGRFLYADQAGTMWVAERTASRDFLRNLETCETTRFEVPIGIGRVFYHPGA